MAKKVLLVVPEAPAPAAMALVDERRIEKKRVPFTNGRHSLQL